MKYRLIKLILLRQELVKTVIILFGFTCSKEATLLCKQSVVSSILTGSTNLYLCSQLVRILSNKSYNTSNVVCKKYSGIYIINTCNGYVN